MCLTHIEYYIVTSEGDGMMVDCKLIFSTLLSSRIPILRAVHTNDILFTGG